MSDLKEYVDDEGKTYLLNEADAEASGFKAAPSRKNKQADQPKNKQATPNDEK